MSGTGGSQNGVIGKTFRPPDDGFKIQKIKYLNVKDRVKEKLRSWKGRLLNKVGKEVLLKSLIKTLSNYVMSRFKSSKQLGKDTERSMASFW